MCTFTDRILGLVCIVFTNESASQYTLYIILNFPVRQALKECICSIL